MIDQKSRVFHTSITQERTRELELLIHLISNSRQALVVCGPEGIGKSTLLKVLQERKIESWLYCLVQGHADLSFEKIQEQTAQAIKQILPDKQVQALSGVLRLVESRHKKIVLMIDEAGNLTPGLISKIIEYATDNPVLRVIFVLTHDDLFVKNRSDSAIDDCHLIEIPPLSEKQCGEFLQYLATKPRSQVAFNKISDSMIEAVYRETQGIPGRIIAEIPGLKGAKQRNNPLWILVAAVAGLVALAFGIQWFSGSEYNIKLMPAPALDVQNSVSIESSLPQASPANRTQQKEHANDAQAKKTDDTKTVNNTELSTPKILPPQQTPTITEEQAEASVVQNDGEQWLKKQPIDNYTLQLMVLSKEQTIKDVMKKYPLMGQNLLHIKSVVNGKARFVLLYGSFTSTSLANQAKKSLPPEFRNSVTRKISAFNNKL